MLAAANPTPLPGPKSRISELFEFRRRPLARLTELHRAYGDTVGFKLGQKQVVLLAGPEGVARVLVENHRNYEKQSLGYQKLRLALGEGLLTSDGDFWRRQRRIAQPAFHRDRLMNLGSHMTESTVKMLNEWDSAPSHVDVAKQMMTLTLDIIGRTMFSRPMSEFATDVGQVMDVALHYLDERMNSLTAPLSFVERLPLPSNRRFRAAMRDADQMMVNLIAERRGSAKDPGDLLSMLLDMKDEETGETMTDRQLRDEMMTMIAAGHETTANALTWTFYLLSQHPDAGERLRRELETQLAGRVPSVSDLPKLTFLTSVIKESMRLYPPAWIISRNAVEADPVVQIPKGAIVIVSPYVTHRSARHWMAPERFDPDRFSAERASSIPKHAYFPFGGGPRQCIGVGFAMMEAQLLLATIAQRYAFELEPGHKIELDPSITLRPKGGMPMKRIRLPSRELRSVG